jgi:hypothetical protein
MLANHAHPAAKACAPANTLNIIKLSLNLASVALCYAIPAFAPSKSGVLQNFQTFFLSNPSLLGCIYSLA